MFSFFKKFKKKKPAVFPTPTRYIDNNTNDYYVPLMALSLSDTDDKQYNYSGSYKTGGSSNRSGGSGGDFNGGGYSSSYDSSSSSDSGSSSGSSD